MRFAFYHPNIRISAPLLEIFSLLNALLKCINEFIAAKNHKKLENGGQSDQKLTKNELDFITIKIDEFRTSERSQIGKSKKRK